MIGVYKITSPSGKIYIGQSWNIERRFKEYTRKSNKKQTKLYNSFLKHGVETHKFEIICEFPNDIDQKILDNYEIFCYDQYKEGGYLLLNSREAGRGGKLSEEAKRKIGLIHKGKKLSKEEIIRREESVKRNGGKSGMRGKKHSIESIEKMRENTIGQIHSEETKNKIRISKLGKSRSPNVIEKIRLSKLGIVQSKGTVQKRILKLKKAIDVYDLKGVFIKSFDSIKEASEQLPANVSKISLCLNNKRKSLKGFTFKFKTKKIA